MPDLTTRSLSTAHWRLVLYVTAVVVGTGLSLALSVVDPLDQAPDIPMDWVLLSVLTGSAILGQTTRSDLFGDSFVSLSIVPLVAIGLLLGPVPAGLAALIAIGGAHAFLPYPWFKVLFNSATVALSTVAAVWTFHLLAPPIDGGNIEGQLLPAFAASLMAYVGNAGLVAGVVAISTGERFMAVWSEKYRWLIPHYLTLGVIAFALAVSYSLLGFVGMAIFVVPMAMQRLVVRQYTERTRASVEKLQKAYGVIRSSERRFRSLVRNAPGVVAVVDPDGTFQYASGSDPPEGDGGNRQLVLADVVHPDDLSRIRSVFGKVQARPGSSTPIELRMRRRDGDWREFEAIVSNLLEDEDVGGMVMNAHDVTDRKRLEDQLRHQAFHDSLTDLPNRALFVDRLEHALQRAGRDGKGVAVLFLDLDRFKNINDSLGHDVGDDLLKEVGRRIAAVGRPGDTMARFGGDEFVVLLEDVDTPNTAVRVAERLLAAVREPVQLRHRTHIVTAGIGIAIASTPRNATDLLKSADAAMYHAKAIGRSRYAIFDDARDRYPVERLDLEADLHRALARSELRVFYQPVMDLQRGVVRGFEALVRWQHPRRGLIAPGDFIPLAEESGAIIEIGQWVLEEACRQARRWDDQLSGAPLHMSVNLSAPEFQEPDLVARVKRVLDATGLSPERLRIEVTESILMDDNSTANEVLTDLKGLGLKVAIDDFGTGYSSLNYLLRMPVDVLKIDRSFVMNLGTEPRYAAIVKAVVSLADALGMSVTAEGIEEVEQQEFLTQIGCDTAQGFLFARPLPASQVIDAVRALNREAFPKAG